MSRFEPNAVPIQRYLEPFRTNEEGEHRNTSSSYSSLISTLLPLLVISIPLIFTFLFLRRKVPRVYAPRTFIDILHDEEKTPKLEKRGSLNWFPEFWHRSDEEVLNTQNLDSYLFLRFLKTITVISFIGFCLTLPLIFVNYMGGRGKSELGSLTISNVKNPGQYYWHCLVAWLFFGYVMYSITRETIHYINLRYAYFLSPRQASRVSSRTVLFTSVSNDWLDEEWLRAEFDQIKRVWIETDCKELGKLVKDRDSTAFRLEDAEVKLISIANDKRLKGEVYNTGAHGSITSRYVGANERPKTKSIPLIWNQNDTIFSSRAKLIDLIPKVKKEQKFHLDGLAEALPAVFVQFETQRAAQAAFQTGLRVQPGNMEPRCINSLPEEIIWENLGISRWSRIARVVVVNTFIVFLILFWTVPVGLISSLADIEAIADNVPVLGFINRFPVPILGAITGLLPALLISVLLALVPIICRFLASHAGAVTLAQVELRTQSWYFAFQVIQVFLVTTLSSGASGIAKEIFDDPTKAPSLLAENLPQASNFYLSYFMLQGITVAASEIFQIVPLLMLVASRFLDTTPRSKYNRWTALSGLSWGNTYPKLTNLAVIALAYSCIAPLTLPFAAVGLGLLYLAFRYNIFYALITTVNTNGDAYGRALQHLTVGVYLAELCLIGLFGARNGNGPAQLMVLLLITTIFYQVYLNWALNPLLNSLSDKLLAEEEEEALSATRMENGESNSGGPNLGSLINDNLGTKRRAGESRLAAHRNRGGYFAPYIFHGSKSSYSSLHAKFRSSFPGRPGLSIPKDVADTAYLNPAITAPLPKLWIVKDEMGISTEQIRELEVTIGADDKGASFNGKGNIVWDKNNIKDVPIWKERLDI